MQSGFNQADLQRLNADAAAAPAVVKDELSRGLRRAGVQVQDAVKRGFSWSSKIPEKVHLDVQSGKSPRARVTVDDPSGEASAINNNDKPGFFRHPVFAHPEGERDIRTRAAQRRLASGKSSHKHDWVWVSQPARPSFLTNAIPAAIRAERDISDAMDRAASRLGFH